MTTELHTFFNLPTQYSFDNQNGNNSISGGFSTLPTPTIGLNSAKPPVKELPEAVKYDEGKVDYTLVSLDGLEEIAKVFSWAAKTKYSDWNFAEGNGLSWKRIWKSLARHIFAWLRGKDNDPESGLNHLAHAGCCIIMLLHYIKSPDRYNKDDRYKY